MEILGFHHVAIQVRDLERVAAFYTSVLELPERARHFRPDGTLRSVWVGVPDGFLALEAVEGALEESPFRHSTPGLLLVALRIAPAARAAALKRLAEHGVQVVHETAWTAYFRDPEGNRIALSHHPEVANG